MVLTLINLLKVITTNANCNEDFQAIITTSADIFEDNNGAYTVARNCRVTSRTKYFNVDLHHFWDNVEEKIFNVLKCDTKDQYADYLTKGNTHVLFTRNRSSVQGW